MAANTFTIILLPDCLYTAVSGTTIRKVSSNPISLRHSRGVNFRNTPEEQSELGSDVIEKRPDSSSEIT